MFCILSQDPFSIRCEHLNAMVFYGTCVLLLAQETGLGMGIKGEEKRIEEGSKKGKKKEKDLETYGYCRGYL